MEILFYFPFLIFQRIYIPFPSKGKNYRNGNFSKVTLDSRAIVNFPHFQRFQRSNQLKNRLARLAELTDSFTRGR